MPDEVEPDYPAIYEAADAHSVAAQRAFVRYRLSQLVLGVLAAIGGAFSWDKGGADWFGVLAVASFAGAAIVQGVLLRSRPERAWYEGRAAAESAKSLTWRYAVAGEPFARQSPEREADQYFITRVRRLTVDLATLDFPSSDGAQITEWMRATRRAALDDRKQAYQSGRVREQQNWYSRRAQEHRRSAATLGAAALASHAIGLLLGVLKATGTTSVDLLGVAVALATSLVAWSQTKQHESSARAYAIASHELASVDALIAHVGTDDDWARFVDEAEEAISREHTLWRASAVRTS